MRALECKMLKEKGRERDRKSTKSADFFLPISLLSFIQNPIAEHKRQWNVCAGIGAPRWRERESSNEKNEREFIGLFPFYLRS